MPCASAATRGEIAGAAGDAFCYNLEDMADTIEETRRKAGNAAQVLESFLTDDRNRLQYSARRRRAMQGVIADGGDVTAYPIAKWITAVSREIVALMMQRATEYNGANPWDKITPNDLGDVVRTTAAYLA